jgi:WD40 repeat protein
MTLKVHLDVGFVHVIEDNKVVSSSKNKSIKIWDLVSGQCIKTIEEDVDENYEQMLSIVMLFI